MELTGTARKPDEQHALSVVFSLLSQRCQFLEHCAAVLREGNRSICLTLNTLKQHEGGVQPETYRKAKEECAQCYAVLQTTPWGLVSAASYFMLLFFCSARARVLSCSRSLHCVETFTSECLAHVLLPSKGIRKLEGTCPSPCPSF